MTAPLPRVCADVAGALMCLPVCPKQEQHGQMELQRPGSPEQAFCGTWYRCSSCGSSTLFTSPALEQHLAAFRAQAVRS